MSSSKLNVTRVEPLAPLVMLTPVRSGPAVAPGMRPVVRTWSFATPTSSSSFTRSAVPVWACTAPAAADAPTASSMTVSSKRTMTSSGLVPRAAVTPAVASPVTS